MVGQLALGKTNTLGVDQSFELDKQYDNSMKSFPQNEAIQV